MTIVGVDCATVNQRTGLTFASCTRNGTITIDECFVAQPRSSIASQIRARLSNTPSALIALDAPLGWPTALGIHLSKHHAGKAFAVDSETLFRRRTDQIIKKRLHKAPLEVAANFLARTAVVALRTLKEISELCNTEVSIAWQPPEQGGIYAIEVYPAGTLRAYQQMGFVSKKEDTGQSKKALLKKLQHDGRLRFAGGRTMTISNEHVTDSVLCCVAALDFLQGYVIAPTADDKEFAKKEGWIWVRNPDV